MPAVTITPTDLAPFAAIPDEKATAMIADALGLAAQVAPCILEVDFKHPDAAKAVLRGAILRWHDSGSGAAASKTWGPYSETLDTRTPRRAMFWPSEIEQLQSMCATSTGAFTIDAVPCDPAILHADICTVNFGGYCSCGAWLTGRLPLYEQ